MVHDQKLQSINLRRRYPATVGRAHRATRGRESTGRVPGREGRGIQARVRESMAREGRGRGGREGLPRIRLRRVATFREPETTEVSALDRRCTP